MPNRPLDTETVRLLAMIVAALAAAALVMGVVMALAMGDMMGGPMTGVPQGTPVVLDEDKVTIDIKDFAYSPPNISVKAGAEVTWTNRDAAPHTATDKAAGWDTGPLGKGDAATIALDTPGVFDYICTIHPYMKGKIAVR